MASRSAMTCVSIFIASIARSVSPLATSCPGRTATATTVPARPALTWVGLPSWACARVDCALAAAVATLRGQIGGRQMRRGAPVNRPLAFEHLALQVHREALGRIADLAAKESHH